MDTAPNSRRCTEPGQRMGSSGPRQHDGQQWRPSTMDSTGKRTAATAGLDLQHELRPGAAATVSLGTAHGPAVGCAAAAPGAAATG
eukprot:4351690-Heterocapsa_arctica.AAC.1